MNPDISAGRQTTHLLQIKLDGPGASAYRMITQLQRRRVSFLTACCQTGCEQFVSTTPVGPVDDRSEPAGRIVPRPRIFAADIKGRAGLADLLATRSAADLVRLALAVEPGVPLVPTDDAARMLHGHPLDGSALDPSFRPGLRGATHVLRCRRETARSVARTRETPARRESAALIVGSLDRVQIHRCLANTADH
jgi:hypothetical protein